jgi:MFS family permease
MKITGVYLTAVLTGAISLLGLMLLPPVLPWMIEPMSASESTIGLLMSAFTLPQIIVSPLTGILTDRFGRKKVLFPSLLIYSITGALIALATSLPLALILRFCQGAVGAGFYPLATALIGDLYLHEDRQEANAIMAGVVGFAGIVIPAVGGFLALIDWRTPFLLFLSGLLVAGMVWKKIPSSPSTGTTDNASSKPSYRYLFSQSMRSLKSWRLALTSGASLILFGINMGCLLTFYPIFAKQQLGATQDLIGAAQAITFAAATLTSFLYGPAAKRLRTSVLGVISFTLYGGGLVWIPYSPTFFHSIIPLFIIGLGFGLAIPMLNNEVLEATPPEIRGTAAAIYQSTVRLGQTLTPIIFGLVLIMTGRFEWIFWLGSAATFTVTLLYLIDTKKKRIDETLI